MRFNRLVPYVALILVSHAFAWENVSTDNGLYDDSLGNRVSIYKKDGRYIPSTGRASGRAQSEIGNTVSDRINSFNSDGSPNFGDEVVSYSTPQAALKGAIDNGFCGSRINYSTLTCFTGGADSGSSTTPNAGGNGGNGGGGSGGNGGGSVPSGSVLPPSMPVLPIPAEIPESRIDKELREAIQALRKRYQNAFEALKDDEKLYKRNLANSLNNCVLLYGGTNYHDTCAKNARSGFEENLKNLKKQFETLKRNMAADFAELLKSAGLTSPNVPNPTINGGSAGGSGGDVINNTTNTTNETNITNETINNTTTNVTNVSNGGSGSGNNITIKTQDYSGFLGSISGSLNDIKNKLSGLLNGVGGSNNGSNTQPQSQPAKKGDDKDDKEKECKKGTLGCTEVGSADDVKLPGNADFGIKTQTIDVSKNFNWRRVVGGNETCPAPIKINTPLFVKDIPLQPLCDFAQMIRGVVVLIFAIWGMRIALKGDN